MNYYHAWVLATLVLAALPSLIRLPLWVAAPALAGGIIHYAGPWRKKWQGKLVSALLLTGTGAGIWFSFSGFFTGNGVLAFFITVVFLKWGESETRRDYLLLIFASVILAAVGALYFENLLSLIHMLAVVFALTVSLVAIHMDGAGLRQMAVVRSAGKLFFLGLPLMLLLFTTFPRIPGPIWDLGLAFGLPIKALMDRGDGQFGKIKKLAPGGIQQKGAAEQNNQNVLVAEFDGAVPFKSRLYWRGPVFWDFDGTEWTLPDSWDNRNTLLKHAIRSKARLDRELRWRSRPVRYTLRVMPNGGRWLYGLDVPAAPAPEVFISDEFQLLSIRNIDDFEPKLKMLAYLDYRIGSTLTPAQRKRALAWPENTNPRLKALGRKIASRFTQTRDIEHEALKFLITEKVVFDPAHAIAPGPDMLDRYFFDEKRGGTEYLAGSIAMLMRAAGVPSRLVSGFRGGTIIALTDFVIVKRSDAHVWLEIWEEGQGWKRLEPKDIVTPPGEERAQPQEKKVTDAGTQVKIDPVETGKEPVKIRKKTPETTPKAKAPEPEEKQWSWALPDWSGLFGGFQKWVINYDPDRQMEILKGVGIEKSNWLDLMVTGAGGVAMILLVYLGAAFWRNRARTDRVGKSWNKFRCRMAKFDAAMAPRECPGNYMNRVAREKPELAEATSDIIQRYIDIRYKDNPSSKAATLFRRQVDRFISMT